MYFIKYPNIIYILSENPILNAPQHQYLPPHFLKLYAEALSEVEN